MSDLRDISEAEVMQEVKEVIKLTGIKLQRINVGCFKVGNNFIRTADNGTLDFEGYDKLGRFIAGDVAEVFIIKARQALA